MAVSKARCSDVAPDQVTHQQEEVQMWAFIFQMGSRRSGETGERTHGEGRSAAAGALEAGPAEATRLRSRVEARSVLISGKRPTLRRSRRSRNDGVLGLRWLS
jgi:hypothetical protein